MPWTPIDEEDEFPTLGYDIADWMTAYLLTPDKDGDEQIPFVPTQEQLDQTEGCTVAASWLG